MAFWLSLEYSLSQGTLLGPWFSELICQTVKCPIHVRCSDPSSQWSQTSTYPSSGHRQRIKKTMWKVDPLFPTLPAPPTPDLPSWSPRRGKQRWTSSSTYSFQYLTPGTHKRNTWLFIPLSPGCFVWQS